MKEQDDRIQECLNIYKQLQSMGILQLDYVKELLKKNINDFIHNNIPNTFEFSIPNSNSIIQIKLTTQNKQSGITLVQ